MAADGELTCSERIRSSRAWPLVAVFLLAVPLALPLPVAVFGDTSETVPLIVGALCLVAVIAVQDRAYLRLSRADRRRIWRIERSGSPSDDQRLDAMALARLDRAVCSASGKSTILVILVASIAATIIAALLDSHWWLLCLPAGPGVGLQLLANLRGDPQGRRDRLATALGADEPPRWWRYRPKPGSVTS